MPQHNVSISEDKDKITLVISKKVAARPGKEGKKNDLLASTGGFVALQDGRAINLNITQPRG